MKVSEMILGSIAAVAEYDISFESKMELIESLQVQYTTALKLESDEDNSKALAWYNATFITAPVCPITEKFNELKKTIIGGKLTKKVQLDVLGVYLGRLDLTVNIVNSVEKGKFIEVVGSKTTSFGNDTAEFLFFNVTTGEILDLR